LPSATATATKADAAMRRAAAFVVLLALGSPGAMAQDDSAPAANAEKTESESAPVAFIASLYKTYTDIAPGEDGEPGLPQMYSRRLQALIDKDAAETPEGEVGRLDWDPVVDGQDWELSGLKITEVFQSGGEARVRAVFANMGDRRNILFNLVREDGQWRIDDIAETLKPRWTMSKILSDAPDAFPDAPEEKDQD
jgi:hypothetical protein